MEALTVQPIRKKTPLQILFAGHRPTLVFQPDPNFFYSLAHTQKKGRMIEQTTQWVLVKNNNKKRQKKEN